MKNNIKFGDKVKIPKTYKGYPITESFVIIEASRKKLDFLYYRGKNNDDYILSNELTGQRGDSFYEDEVELYEEFILPEKWCIKGSPELHSYQKDELNNESNCGLSHDDLFQPHR